MFRIGHGMDVHRFAEGRQLVLGGVLIPHEKGLLGHSDADVLVHSIMDALLGASALGDIGMNFPDNDSRYKDASSIALLKKTAGMVRDKGYAIGNIDSTIAAEAPKLSPYINEMRANIAKVCGISLDCVSVKATTEEGLGFTGRLEGNKSYAVALISN